MVLPINGYQNPNQSLVSRPQITAQGLQFTNPNQSPVASSNVLSQGVDPTQSINLFEGGAAPGGAGAGDFSSMQDWFGGTNEAGASTMGYVPAALGIGQFAANTYFGLKNYGIAKEQLEMQKESFNFNRKNAKKQLNNQATLVNQKLRDRQRARNISNPGQAQDVDSYMKENGVSGYE